MDYAYTDDEKFYADLSKTLNELLYTDNFPIPHEAKKKLWFQIYETERYEEQKKSNIKELSNQLGESLKKLGENVGYILETASNIIPELERAKVNGQIALTKIGEVNQTLQEVKKEQGKLEVKLTTALILKQMRDQRN